MTSVQKNEEKCSWGERERKIICFRLKRGKRKDENKRRMKEKEINCEKEGIRRKTQSSDQRESPTRGGMLVEEEEEQEEEEEDKVRLGERGGEEGRGGGGGGGF